MAAVVEWRYANLGQYIDERKLEIMLLEKTRGIPILQMHDFRITHRNDATWVRIPRGFPDLTIEEIESLRVISDVEQTAADESHSLSEIPILREFSGTDFAEVCVGNEENLFLKVDQRVKSDRFEGNFEEGTVVGQGQSGIVYATDALRTTRQEASKSYLDKRTVKVAVKRLFAPTSLNAFIAEKEALEQVRNGRHANIVQLIESYRSESTLVQKFHLIFPLAKSNLKQLFRGDDPDLEADFITYTLWSQFEGLASGLEHINVHCHLLHTDIKPTNILLYLHPSGSHLEAKIADFGLAKNLKNAIIFNRGSVEAQSAMKYDAPEVRMLAKELAVEPSKPLPPGPLLKGEIWKLGEVFVDLLTFLLEGSQGVKAFRARITRTDGRIDSDAITDTRFDDGTRAKPEVYEWLFRLSTISTEATELYPLIAGMLGEARSRPAIDEVVRQLGQSSLRFYWDGIRIPRFFSSQDLQTLSLPDRLKHQVERTLRSKVDWAPLKQGHRPCQSEDIRIVWNWCNEKLSADVPYATAISYKQTCVPVTDVIYYPTLPTHTQQTSSRSPDLEVSSVPMQNLQIPVHYNSAGGRHQSDGSANMANIGDYLPESLSQAAQKIYWCVDRCWSEPSYTERTILDAKQLNTDRDLFQQLDAHYTNIRGQLGRFLSWKSCQDVAFIKYCINVENTDDVSRVQKGLPPAAQADSTSGYAYLKMSSDEIHQIVAAKQIIRGMRHPQGYRGSLSLGMIPKHLDSVPRWPVGTTAWGIHAIQGWSLKKILYWIGSLTILGLAFVPFWLAFINNKDLQSAFTPLFFVGMMTTIAAAIPQLLSIA